MRTHGWPWFGKISVNILLRNGDSFVLGLASDPFWVCPRGCTRLFSSNMSFRSNAFPLKTAWHHASKKNREKTAFGGGNMKFHCDPKLSLRASSDSFLPTAGIIMAVAWIYDSGYVFLSFFDTHTICHWLGFDREWGACFPFCLVWNMVMLQTVPLT